MARPRKIFISKQKHAREILNALEMFECKEIATPMVNVKLSMEVASLLTDIRRYMKLVNSLIYLCNTC